MALWIPQRQGFQNVSSPFYVNLIKVSRHFCYNCVISSTKYQPYGFLGIILAFLLRLSFLRT